MFFVSVTANRFVEKTGQMSFTISVVEDEAVAIVLSFSSEVDVGKTRILLKLLFMGFFN